MRRSLFTLCVLCATLVPTAAARADDSSMTLSDGTRFSFELVRSAGQTRRQLGSGVFSGNGEGYRLIFDSNGKRFFGYRVKATPLPKGGFRLELGPLGADVIARVSRRLEEQRGERLTGESLAIEYPPPEEVRDDEPLLLDLMVNPKTGEKLSDVIRVSATNRTVPDPLAVQEAVLMVNGIAQPALASASGRYLWFALPERGRFVIGLEAVPGRTWAPAQLDANRTVRFSIDGDTYEWSAAAPIARTSSVPVRLWVWHDTGFKVSGTFSIGAMDRLPER
jgi:hypothetical protein